MAHDEEHVRRLAEFPDTLRTLVTDELAAGNSLAGFSSGHPAPPAGDCVRLVRRVTTRARASGGGLSFRVRPSTQWSGEFTDERGFYFVLEPPDSRVERFRASLTVNLEQWRDGVGYDLGAITAATLEQRAQMEALLLSRAVTGWRDVEALVALGTDAAMSHLRAARENASSEVSLALLRHAPWVVTEAEHAGALARALDTCELGDGLSKAIDLAAEFHPDEVVEALWRGVQDRPGEVAVHFAGLLLFIHGAAESPFDWSARPFLLRFRTEDRRERGAAIAELRARVGLDR